MQSETKLCKHGHGLALKEPHLQSEFFGFFTSQLCAAQQAPAHFLVRKIRSQNCNLRRDVQQCIPRRFLALLVFP